MNPNERHACRPPFEPPHVGATWRCPYPRQHVWTGRIWRSLGPELDQELGYQAGQLYWTVRGLPRTER